MSKLLVLAASAALLGAAAPGGAALIVNAGSPGTTGATALYLNLRSEVSVSDTTATEAEIATFIGKPDDSFSGLGQWEVTYDLGAYRLVNRTGQDFNVYETDSGGNEFSLIDVLVSADGTNFFNVDATVATALNLAGDETHGDANFRRSFDLTGAVAALGATRFRYLRIDGKGGGAIGGTNDFDLDAVGIASFATAVPEPATWAMMVSGFGLAGAAARRRRPSFA